LAGDLGGEPPHDMERRLDELDGEFHQDSHAQAAGADARQQSWAVDIPDDPYGGADDGYEEGEKGEGEAQQPAQRPALAVALAAHPSSSSIPFFLVRENTKADQLLSHGESMKSFEEDINSTSLWYASEPSWLSPRTSDDLSGELPKLSARNEPLMAAAESRPARQRIASRCLVQDDADGAPRLAWCPSSTSKYTETAVPTSKLDGGSLPVDFIKFVLKREDMVSTASMKSGSGTRVKEVNTTTIYSQQPLKKKTNMDFVYKVEKLLELKPVDQLALRKSDKASSHLETPGSGCNKPEAWWRIADKDDLALLVAQKSLQHIENCDLPKSTQTVHYMKDLFSSIENLDASEIFQSSFGICNANEYSHDSSSTGSSDDMNLPSGERGCLLHDSEKL
ncbi:unnamed protein product, partial [Musa textilis]